MFNSAAEAQRINAGDRAASATIPFTAPNVADFNTPWALAFLHDGRMLVTEKLGRIFLVTQEGRKFELRNVPDVLASGQTGMLDIAVAPDFETSSTVYFTYVEPGDGGRLVLSRATLRMAEDTAMLADVAVIWRQTPGGGGQSGGIIAFDPAGTHLFLSVGERMRPESAQDPEQARGKVLRLNLDGSTPQDNPLAARGACRPRHGRPAIAIPTASPSHLTVACGSMRWGRAAATN
jgi:glucose/arabinose dehydrogenase